MKNASGTHETIVDFVTGKKVPNVGVEEHRQIVERFLVEEKGYQREDIEVDAEIAFTLGEERFCSEVDLVVQVNGTRFMVIKLAPGSLGSRHREALAAARLLDTYQIPISVITNGKDAEILDSVTGTLLDQGIAAIPAKQDAVARLSDIVLEPYPEAKLEREKIIFRSYDQMNVNVQRNLRS